MNSGNMNGALQEASQVAPNINVHWLIQLIDSLAPQTIADLQFPLLNDQEVLQTVLQRPVCN